MEILWDEFITEKEHEVNEEGIKNYSIDQCQPKINFDEIDT